MRLKTIPEGATIIQFANPHGKTMMIHWNKKPFLAIRPNSFVLIDCQSFFCGMPLSPHLPELKLYANLKPIINVVYTEVIYANT